MALSVDTPASETDLVELATVKEALGGPTGDDAYLTRLIEAASDAIRAFTGRILSRQVYVETVRAHGGPYLKVTETPVVDVDSIVVEGATVAAADYSIEHAEAGLLFNASGWQDTALRSGSWNLGGSIQNPGWEEPIYAVTYTAGYLLPGEVGRTLPRDIEQAAVETVRQWYASGPGLVSSAGSGAVKRKTVDDLTLEYDVGAGAQFTGARALPPVAIALLRPYRRLAAA